MYKCVEIIVECLSCGPNEILNSCPKYGTADSDCDSVFGGFQRYCPPQPADYQCTPRCDCKEGFVRDADQNCIPAEKCKFSVKEFYEEINQKNFALNFCSVTLQNIFENNPMILQVGPPIFGSYVRVYEQIIFLEYIEQKFEVISNRVSIRF